MTVIVKRVTRPYAAFRDRAEAGRQLAERILEDYGGESGPAAVLAVPRGGVPVAQPLARALRAPLGLILVRKLPIPDSPEAGFGAVALDGSVVLNDPLVRALHLDGREVDAIAAEVLAEVRRRAIAYLGHDRPPEVEGRDVFLVDDGLASGFTMIAGATMVRKRRPRRLILAVPVAPASSLSALEPHVDQAYCLLCQADRPFAVASFYERFPDLADEEVRAILA